MYETSERIGRDHTQKPQDCKNYRYRPKQVHDLSPYMRMFFMVSPPLVAANRENCRLIGMVNGRVARRGCSLEQASCFPGLQRVFSFLIRGASYFSETFALLESTSVQSKLLCMCRITVRPRTCAIRQCM